MSGALKTRGIFVKHNNNFDLLRLMAAAQVMFMHAVGHLHLPTGQPLTTFVWAVPGVPCFFIISGFLVMGSALQSSSVGSFFRKRALRIYPALIVNILILELVVFSTGQLLGGKYPLAYAETLAAYMATASVAVGTFLTKIPEIYTFQSGPFDGLLPFYPSGVMWTLTIELSFYLVVPLFAFLVLWNRRLALIAIAAAFTASVLYAQSLSREFSAQHEILDSLVPQYFWMFAIGMIARISWHRIAPLFEGKALFWVPLYFVVSFYGYRAGWFELAIDFHYDTSPVLAARIVLLACALLSAAYTFQNASAFLRGNDISYGVYLWHMLFITLALALGFKESAWLWIAVPGCTLAAAAASWVLVERPALRLKEGWQIFRVAPSANTESA
jgi:peptidoglycan/LPS O-acetylase OafA/YrhL